MGLSEREIQRYRKHTMIDGIGEKGQMKLKNAKVLVIGAGGLGCPVLQYLTAAGVGTIGIVEYDLVDESNLQRQILYGTMDRGKLKSIITRDRLNMMNDLVNIEIYNIRCEPKNIMNLLIDYQIVVDATDNYESRYVINDACVLQGKPMVHGAIYKFEGQVSVFNYNDGPTYRCYNPEAGDLDNGPDPSDVGLLGVLPGITGTYMANEVIKILLGIGEVLSGKVLFFNILNNSFYTINVHKDPANLDINKLKS